MLGQKLLMRMGRAIKGIFIGSDNLPPVITTSTASTATAYSNQRKIDRTSNGVLWTMHAPFADSTGAARPLEFRYSVDDGVTWVYPGSASQFSDTSGSAYGTNGSLFIDVDDFAHVTYKSKYDGFIYYRRGTPNAERTAWTWSAATVVYNGGTQMNYPDIMAHREGTGWKAHIAVSYVSGSTDNNTYYYPVTITSAGAISVGAIVTLGGAYSNSAHTYPSIDFNHTGDGKTVANGTPHLYVAWSAGATGAGKGIRFKKATYNAGTWTWGTEREVDSTRYVFSVAYWLNCMFDGTRVIIPSYVYSGSGADLVLYERDALDTVTISNVLGVNLSNSDQVSRGSSSYDSNGDVFFVGQSFASVQRLGYRKWTRATGVTTAVSEIDTTSIASSVAYVSAKRGYSGDRIEFIYTDGTASPYSIKYSYVGGPVELYPAQITTSTAATATAYSNQRKVDRTSNGVLWTININDGIRLHARYSLDEGITWSAPDSLGPGGAATYVMNASLFIDQDDYAHVVYKNPNDGFIYYRRGTPNAARTSWTWSAATELVSAANYDYPDIVAFPNSSGGWKAFVVVSRSTTTPNAVAYYYEVTITAGDAISATGPTVLGSYSNTGHTYPSIDFNHIGDGKTVKDGTPHLYVAWSAGATGAGKGIRFKKATYSGGSWTWGTEREIDSTRYVDGALRWLNCLFDGARVIIGGRLFGADSTVVAYERNVADTITTALFTGGAVVTSGSMSYDSEGNLYFIGYNGSFFYLTRWVRASETLDGQVNLGSLSGGAPYFSAKRGYSENKIEFIYFQGPSSPYSIMYGAIV